MHTTTHTTSRLCRTSLRLVLLPLLLASISCRAITKSPYDLIEAELRTKERELADTRSQLRNSKNLNDAYQRTPRGMAATGDDGAPFLPIKELTLGSGTGGADNDNQPGDEALQVVLVPKDEDGSAVKVPANVLILAYETSRNGTKCLISRWDIGADQLRRTWRSGLFATGYYIPLQWDQLPAFDKVRIVVRLQTLDGRAFEADKDITVRVLPGVIPNNRGIAPPAMVPQPGVFPPSPTQEYPYVPNDLPANPGGGYIPSPTVPVVPPSRPKIEELPPPVESRSPVRISPAREK
jgi:hypothetical protein